MKQDLGVSETLELSGPPAIRLCIPQGSYTNEIEHALRWTGIGTFAPDPVRSGAPQPPRINPNRNFILLPSSFIIAHAPGSERLKSSGSQLALTPQLQAQVNPSMKVPPPTWPRDPRG
jgi:hypothetical protein